MRYLARIRPMVLIIVALIPVTLLHATAAADAASVKPGDLITPDNASAVYYLVSPGNFVLVRQGMRMKIVATGQLDWPPPYKAATEQYSGQVQLNGEGEIHNYVAGLPFPFIDPNDPQVATKVLWNFSYGPQTTDVVDARNVETASYRASGPIWGGDVFHATAGKVFLYDYVGRTEVPPIPTDYYGLDIGVRYRFFVGPILEGGGSLLRLRYIDPDREDDAWYFSLGRVKSATLSNSFGGSTLDADSYSGFAAKVEEYNYRLLGLRPMLASVHADSPAQPCKFDNNRTVCPDNWEMRQLYVVEATLKPKFWHRFALKRILYIDSEGWFITASDQYDQDGELAKTLVVFNAYRDRGTPQAHIAIYPFRRMFETALVDEDVQTGFSTVSYMPGREAEEHECWYINMGAVKQASTAASTVVVEPHPGGTR